MAFVEEMFKGNIGSGLAVGIGVAVVAPLLAPVIGGVVRPLAKTVIKAGLLAGRGPGGLGAAERSDRRHGSLRPRPSWMKHPPGVVRKACKPAPVSS